MGGLALVLGAAALVGVLKAATYFIVLWACSIPAISAVGGKRMERAFWGAVTRMFLGILMTAVFYVALMAIGELPGDWMWATAHYAARALLWLVVILTVYRASPFPSPAYRKYFAACVIVSGTLLNVGWDYLLFDGSLLRPGQRWGC